MQDKNDNEGGFPMHSQYKIAENLSVKDVVSVASTSQRHLRMFQPIVAFEKLLHHVPRGNYDVVKSILSAGDKSLFHKKGRLTDGAGRIFENISAFEYALWALDKHMWTTILECLPKDELVINLLKGQYDHVTSQGVTYSFKGETITEKHFDFENTIIKELQTQVNLWTAPGVKDYDAIADQWRKGVGGAQAELPSHVMDEYFSDERFFPVPAFISRPNVLFSKQFNYVHHMDEKPWFHADSKLGSDFAVYKAGNDNGCLVVEHFGSARGPVRDLDAMKALHQVRTQDLTTVKSQIEEQARRLDNNQAIIPAM